MSAKNNQIAAKKIREHPKTDCQKLGGLETHIHSKYPTISVTLEPFMLFSKGEDEYLGTYEVLDEEQVTRNIVHPPDIILDIEGKKVIFELDGPIHDVKTMKTSERNRRYELNDIEFFVINEAELKFKLKIPKTRPLSQEQINDEFDEKIKNYLK